VDDDLAVERRAEAEREGGATRRRPLEVAAGAVVGRTATGRERRLATRLELRGRAVAAIDGAVLEQRLGAGAVERHALALEERSLVPVELEPAERLDDGARRLLGRALAVGVLDAEHEPPAMATRVEKAEERGPCAAEMK